MANLVCVTAVGFSFRSCSDLVDKYYREIRAGVIGKYFEPEHFCGTVLPFCEGTWKVHTPEEYALRVLSDKPASIMNNNFIDNLYEDIKIKEMDGPKRDTIKIFHMTDFHIDFNYTVGASNTCNDMLCCQPQSGEPQSPDQVAGKWGDYRCDLPIWTAEKAKDVLEIEGQPDFILWTGDNVPHDSWRETNERVGEAVEKITKYFEDHFHNSILFPIHGNHEFVPSNM